MLRCTFCGLASNQSQLESSFTCILLTYTSLRNSYPTSPARSTKMNLVSKKVKTLIFGGFQIRSSDAWRHFQTYIDVIPARKLLQISLTPGGRLEQQDNASIATASLGYCLNETYYFPVFRSLQNTGVTLLSLQE